ncbi:MAG TPA: hypothetical protein VFS08_14110 [Gemmatimonadaceae bacterium]|nr:hypothetical protein [Gemmatimonadaceae bacterium]
MRLLASAALLVLAALPVHRIAAQAAADPFGELRWRMIGPHRAGRTKAAAGVPDQPNVFYVGVVNGGVWKTTDYGRTWNPIFDAMPTGSVGAIAVAPSDPNRIYVGSGEGLQRPDLSTGDGIYRSDDAGRTWTHLGLRDGQQIPQIAVDPRDPDRLFVAVLGHPYGPNAERGLFRSADGGRTFAKVLYRDENTGAVDVVLAPDDPNTVYAVLWEARQGPWENASWYGPGSGVYKSTDGGDTWQPINEGLPTFADGLGRIGITVAPSDARRLYATVEVRGTGWVYRSDDAGAHWYRASDDTRPASRPSDFAEIKVDPRDPDVVYTGSIVSWKSTDGGKTWAAFRGAPGGDDYHRLWINPEHPEIILLAADQGAIVTVNGGKTWSSWYNQPTAQLYHVTTDNAFPYRVCGGQQESGSVCIQSRGDYGAITFREWTPVGTEEYGYVAPDPLDPDIVYGGKVTRWNRDTRQVQDVGPRPLRGGDYRTVRTAPLVFSTVNPKALYFGSNVVWRTIDGGTHWDRISPDLTRTDSALPPSVGVYANTPSAQGHHPGVVYTIAPSYVTDSVVWAGTDDGLIHVTLDGGKSWRDVTPPAIRARPWSKISIMDAGRHDARTAYAAVNTFRLDDLRPHIWRTHDGGATWTEIVAGIDSGATVNVVREDPVRPGLLYAGSETQVWVSFDDGDHWRSLRLNMPATSIRDLVVKDQDLVVGTHGRSFWILDDVSPLRQWTDSLTRSDVALVRPATATRWRWNVNTDTPIPPDEPAGENPPDGAIVDYWLRDAAGGPVTLEVLDARQRLVRRYSSADTAMAPRDIGNVPAYWIRPTRVLSATPGLHRFVWDLRWSPPTTANGGSYPIAAIEEDTPREPRGPWVAPGTYTLRLTASGRTVTQPITVRMDPRVTTSPADLQRQEAVSLELRDLMGATLDAQRAATALRARVDSLRAGATGARADSLAARAAQLAALAGGGSGRFGGRGGAGGDETLASLNGELSRLYDLVQDADVPPTTQAAAAIADRIATARALLARWEGLRAISDQR